MSTSTIPRPAKQIVTEVKKFTGVAITTLSGGGAYFAPSSDYSIEKHGYSVIGISLATWASCRGPVVPFYGTTNHVGFMSNVESPNAEIGVLVTYMQN